MAKDWREVSEQGFPAKNVSRFGEKGANDSRAGLSRQKVPSALT